MRNVSAMYLKVFFSCLVLIFLCLFPGFSLDVGIDANAPISAATGDIAAPAQVVAETGAHYVRVNFILGPWASPHDASHHGTGGLSWFETYDQIVNSFVSRGVKVYGLIGAEAVHSSAGGVNTEQYVQDYKTNFVEIVGHFNDRVRIFESFNEPNDWAGGSSAQVEPYWFARMLEQIYLGVKYDDGHTSDSAWQATLVSGPLFSHDLDNVASYFHDVTDAGINQLHWEDVKTQTGSYPLDGLGYHIYVRQGSSDPVEIRNKMKSNLDAIWGALENLEGSATPKKIYVSEIGWTTDYVPEAAQADNLDTAFNFLRQDQRIQLAVWFCLKDFPSGHYGIFRTTGLGASDRKPSWYRFYNQAKPAFDTLQNGGFETGDLTGWTGYGELDGVHPSPWFADIGAYEGAYFYGAAANWGTKNGGLFQRIRANGEEEVTVTAWIRTYRVGGDTGDVACRLGLDPSGFVDPSSGSIAWTDWTESPEGWSIIQKILVPESDAITIFLDYRQAAPEWNITCFDNVELVNPGPAVFGLY